MSFVLILTLETSIEVVFGIIVTFMEVNYKAMFGLMEHDGAKRNGINSYSIVWFN